jgi:predicted PurR-regulated permease PerM
LLRRHRRDHRHVLKVDVSTAPDPVRRNRSRRTASRRSEGPVLVALDARSIVVFIAIAVSSLLLLATAYAARAVLLRLIVAVVLAMAAEPLVQSFERRGLQRGRAVGVSFALIALVLAGFAYLLLMPLIDETRRLVQDGPRLLRQLTQENGQLGFLESRFQIVERARAALDSGRLAATAGPVWNAFGSALQTGGAIITVAFLTLFVQLGGRQWFDSLVDFAPDRARARLRRTGAGISTAVGGYVAGNLLISVICGTVTTSVLFALSVPYAVALGVVVAVLDLLPLVGATLGTIIGAAVAVATRGLWPTVVFVVAMLVYQQVENNVLQPLVYNRTVKISPLATLLSVAIGAQLGGVTGALLGIPFAGALKVVAHEVIASRRGEEAPSDDPDRRDVDPRPALE